jgi:hypothetical protein
MTARVLFEPFLPRPACMYGWLHSRIYTVDIDNLRRLCYCTSRQRPLKATHATKERHTLHRICTPAVLTPRPAHTCSLTLVMRATTSHVRARQGGHVQACCTRHRIGMACVHRCKRPCMRNRGAANANLAQQSNQEACSLPVRAGGAPTSCLPCLDSCADLKDFWKAMCVLAAP